MLKSSLCDYSDACILKIRTITIEIKEKKAISKNCAPFSDCISEINNTQIDNAKDINVAMLMYNLIECSNSYSKISGIVWHYYRDEPNNNTANSQSFQFKVKITGSYNDNKKILK